MQHLSKWSLSGFLSSTLFFISKQIKPSLVSALEECWRVEQWVFSWMCDSRDELRPAHTLSVSECQPQFEPQEICSYCSWHSSLPSSNICYLKQNMMTCKLRVIDSFLFVWVKLEKREGNWWRRQLSGLCLTECPWTQHQADVSVKFEWFHVSASRFALNEGETQTARQTESWGRQFQFTQLISCLQSVCVCVWVCESEWDANSHMFWQQIRPAELTCKQFVSNTSYRVITAACVCVPLRPHPCGMLWIMGTEKNAKNHGNRLPLNCRVDIFSFPFSSLLMEVKWKLVAFH